MEDLPIFEIVSNPSALLWWAYLSIPHTVLVGLLMFALLVLVGGFTLFTYVLVKRLWSSCIRSSKASPNQTLITSPPSPQTGEDSFSLPSPRTTSRLRILARPIDPNAPPSPQYPASQ